MGDRAMVRHGLACTILALTGLVLAVPDPSFARPSFRPAFTGGPFRIVLPTGRPHRHFGPRHFAPRMGIGRPAVTLPAHVAPKVPHPVVRPVALGPRPFRIHRRGFHGSPYPVTYGGDLSYYGAPYDPSDIPVYGSAAADDATLAPVSVPSRGTTVAQERGCRAEQVTVPNAGRGGESAITIVRC
jgi:hypothetical protein